MELVDEDGSVSKIPVEIGWDTFQVFCSPEIQLFSVTDPTTNKIRKWNFYFYFLY
jgi:hypothetical protein